MMFAGCKEQVAPLPAEGFAVRAEMSENTIRVGDAVTLTLTARHPDGSVIRFPQPSRNREIVVNGRSTETRQVAAGIQETEEVFQLTSFRFGEWTVLTGNTVCVFSDGTEKLMEIPLLTLRVEKQLAAGDSKISDIRNIIKPPLKISVKLLVLLLVALIAIAAGVITLHILRKPQTILQIPKQPPHMIARQSLIALRAKEWIADPFFTELSFILRTYLENRFSIHAPESTTEELTKMMSNDSRLNLRDQQTLRNFMTQSDLVKFAGAGAENEVMQNAFTTVENFVEDTKEEQTTENTEHK